MKNSDATKPRILLVDDGQIILSGLARALKEADLHLETTASPHHAMRLFEEGCFDAIVADQYMPELSGLELLAWVGKRYPNALRFVLTGKRLERLQPGVTGQPDGSDVLGLIEQTTEELLAELRGLIERPMIGAREAS